MVGIAWVIRTTAGCVLMNVASAPRPWKTGGRMRITVATGARTYDAAKTDAYIADDPYC